MKRYLVAVLAACSPAQDLGTTTSPISGPIHFDPDAPSGGDGSEARPFRTIREATVPNDLIPEGATVILHGGIYGKSTFTPAWSGTPTAHVTVTAAEGELVIFDPGIDRVGRCVMEPGLCVVAPWVRCASAGDPSVQAACAVFGGHHPDEYVSFRNDFTSDTRWGTMLDSNTRLLTYSRIEDFRATNQSDDTRPLSTRPGFRLDTTPPTERLYTYRGPGLWYDAQHDRIHVRLSHTTLGDGVTNYTGSTNPNLVPMTIASVGDFAVTNKADFITFRNIVFRNGGDTAANLGSAEGVESVRFDRCKFLGARHVVRLSRSAQHTFTNCEFSALLGPWVSRDDVKNTFDFIRPEAEAACIGLSSGAPCSFSGIAGTCTATGFCKDNDAEKKRHLDSSGTCRQTNAILVATSTVFGHLVDLEIAKSEFRDAHDGMQAWGIDTDIHHNLFENINDDVFFTDGADVENLQIHHNVIRKSLHIFSHDFQGDTATNGVRYYYRNVIDNRIPTLGSHQLEPVWRFGTDFKMNQPIGEFYFYYNTVVQANPGPQVLSFGLSDTGKDPQPREYVNNVHVTFDGDVSVHHVPELPSTPPSLSDYNVWNRRRTVVTTSFYFPNGATAPPTWNVHSSYAYPRFVNVPDYGLVRSVPFEDSDYRVTGSEACGAALDLSSRGWPGIDQGTPLDIGAVPCVPSSSVTVGIDRRVVFPARPSPIAEAGDFSRITDADGDGFENVTFSGSQSIGAVSVTWRYGFEGPVVSNAMNFARALPIGTHQHYLAVTDSGGITATDMREVTIEDPDPRFGPNLLSNPGFESGTASWVFASNTSVVGSPVHFGVGAARLNRHSTLARQVTQDVPVSASTGFSISGWIRVQSGARARVIVDWLNANNAVVGSDLVAFVITGSQYTYHSASVTSPATAATARIELVVDPGSLAAAAYFDDLRVRVAD